MIRFIPLSYLEPADGVPAYVIAILGFGPIVIGLSIYFYATRHKRLWEKGIFPKKLSFNADNLLEAHIALGARIMLYEKSKTALKVQFINRYFNRYFQLENYNFSDSLVFSLRHPIKTETVCGWLNEHLKKEGERAQVLYFLVGLAYIHGTLSEKERVFLRRLCEELNLPKEALDRIYAIYTAYHERNKTEETERFSSRKHSKESIYASILGIQPNDDFAKIKSAYRQLVKVYHPDSLSEASEAQQKMAADKFIEIQAAYEFFQAQKKG